MLSVLTPNYISTHTELETNRVLGLSSRNVVFELLVDEAMIDFSRSAPPGLQPIGGAHIAYALQVKNAAFILATFALRHPKPSCVGELQVPAFYQQHHWDRTGYTAGVSCLSRHVPMEFQCGFAVHNQDSLEVVFGRMLPMVRTIILFQGQRRIVVRIRDNSFVMTGSCSGIRLVQALDGHGHVVYQKRLKEGMPQNR